MFLFLFHNEFVKINFFIKNRIDLKQIHNNIVIVNKFINVYNNCDNENFE